MKRNKFSLSHYKLLSMDMGELVPIALMEVLPGDTVQQATHALLRVSPLLAPVMHPVEVRVHHWYVPLRIIWDDFEDFITGGPDGMDATEWPYVGNPGPVVSGSLSDYMGLPVTGGSVGDTSALPFRAYAKIWNESYRDQDLQAELVINTGSGFDNTTSRVMQNVCWEKDYFTSSRPWPAKGPDITIPLSGTAPVKSDGTAWSVRAFGVGGTSNVHVTGGGAGSPLVTEGAVGAATDLTFGPNGQAAGLYADLNAAINSAALSDLREAFALLRYEEARARYGSRYVEYLRYLGVRSSDARLQRPEYLGGGRQIIQFSEVLQTGVTTAGDTDGVGNLTGHGISAMRSNRYRRFFEEHGLVLSLMSVRPKTIYADGIHRSWQRRTKEDYWQRELEHIGQQEIFNNEIYAGHVSPLGTFGYQDRYDEYRRMESGVAGEFRTGLNFWHYARLFGAPPALNADFVKSVPTKRTNQVQTNDVLWVMARHSIQARRMLTRNTKSFVF